MDSISGILYSLYRGKPTHGKWVVACLEGAWPAILGERLANSCRPRFLKRSTLSIEIVDPAWEQALQGVKDQLEKKLCSTTAGEVKRIRLMSREA